jgi:hypothetical protein
MRARIVLLGLAVLMLGTGIATAEESSGSVWDRSVALEVRGDLAGAERLMLHEYGEHPDNYWAGLRLAYLALMQERYQEARSRYLALRERPEAGGDTDVVRGLASALAGLGWNKVKEGDGVGARGEFKEALVIDPANQSASKGLAAVSNQPWIFPEVWSGVTGNSLSRDQWTGWVSYAQVAVSFADRLTVRVAGRFVHYWNSGRRSPWALRNDRVSSYNLDEEFLGVGHESPWWGAELVGARSDTNQSNAILGGAGRLRLGSTWGATVEGAALSAKGGPSNLQTRPMAFLWIGKHVGMQAGARLTWDDRGNGVSGNAGFTLVLDPITILMEGHVGDERWSFGLAGPSIMSFDSKATYGGGATVLWALSKNARLAVQGEGARLRQEGASGAYWTLSAGVQLSLGAQ